MEFSDLSARELARIDAICLEFESRLREGEGDSIDQIVAQRGGGSAELLRRELEAVRAEVEQDFRAETLFAPFGIPELEIPELESDEAIPSGPDPRGSTPNGSLPSDSPPSVSGSPQTRNRPRLAAVGSSPSPSAGFGSAGRFPAHRTPTGGAGQRGEAPTERLPRQGDVIGPYQIGRPVGRGGMGAVYEAIDLRLDRLVAIKFLAAAGSRQRELAERFEREAKAVASLSHPNIVELFDVGVISGLPYAVMEFLRGETLEQRLQGESMSPGVVRRLGAQIADALAAAHAAGVIHRDLKPQNIMLLPRSGSSSGSDAVGGSDAVAADTAAAGDSHPAGDPSDASLDSPSLDSMVKLFDFGLSRAPRSGFESDQDTDPEAGDHRTRSGVILGTPGYLAPEQARGEAVTHAADIFGLGCILHEAFYGTRAFDGATPAERFAAVLREAPTGAPNRRGADPALADVIDRCLAKEPHDRPPSASEIAAQLRRPFGDLATESGQWNRDAPSLSRRRLLEAAAGGILGIAAGGWLKRYQLTDLKGIRSLAVLTLIDETAAEEISFPMGPAGDRTLLSGELLSGMIVNELSRLDVVTVPKFVPQIASTPAEFRRIGKEMEVDAVLSGTFHRVSGGSDLPGEADSEPQIAFNLQIVSAATGTQLWGESVLLDGGENFIEQTRIAGTIAQAIGCTLETSAACEDQPAGDAYGCLVKARTYADPDSVAGLRRALDCFRHASEEDPNLAASHAGIALTSITLAAQSSGAEATEQIETARNGVDAALKLSNMSVDARLAKAMLQWQTLYQYDGALRELRELSMVATNHWQVHHQYGLLLLLLDCLPQALDSLRLAKRLHPASVLLKTDHWRAEWFRGETERAILEAEVIRDDYDAAPLARGLLIDIHEQSRDFERAAAQDDQIRWQPNDSLEDYFAQRSERLDQLPYGPFGPALNRLILEQRREASEAHDSADPAGRESTERQLARLRNAPTPMLPLLLAKHPALQGMTGSAAALELLPSQDLLRAVADHGSI